MPYISNPQMPETIGEGRTASGVTYQSDDGANWAAQVEAVQPGEMEITAEEYAAILAANAAHNDALPEPVPPTPLRAAEFKVAAFDYLGAAAFVMPLAGYIAPALDALNAQNWTLARNIIGLAAQGGALTVEQHTALVALLAEYGIPGA
ncbi:MAG: hypothetical protein WC211_01275 [Dehalococcoidia bacterium]